MTVEAPPVEKSFESMQLSDALKRAIQDVGYEKPTDVQTATFEMVAAGKDIIVQARTGSGKTAAFAIPLIDRLIKPEPRVQAVVLCPTRELAVQVAGEFTRLGRHSRLAVSAVYGGASMSKQIDEISGGAQVVVGTPGRVLDHLRRRTLEFTAVRAFVLDEADEMLSMGFAEELNAIMEFLPKKRQGLLFSATMPEDVHRIARRHLTDPQIVSLSSDHVAPSEVEHHVYFVGMGHRTRELVRIVEIERPDAAIVFCNTKDETERVATELQRAGLAADWLNGDLAQSERERVMKSLRTGETKYLVATDVAARGIDVTGISHVFNWGFPESPEQYVHRTGRTGRAGRKGVAISLITPKDVGNLYFLRLTYGIRPIERSLPSAAEEHTQREMDRIQMIREAFSGEPSEEAYSLARRVLTHDEADRLVAGLLSEFFAIATRDALRSAPDFHPVKASPTDIVVAPHPTTAIEKIPAGPGVAPAPSARARTDRSDRGDRPDRGGRSERDRGRRPGDAQRTDATVPPRREPMATRTDDRPRRVEVHHAERAGSDEDAEVGMEELRLAIGRADGVRAGDLARLVREKSEIGRRDVGRVFVRDRFTLISIRAGLLDKVIGALKDVQLNGVALAPERGKAFAPTIFPPSSADRPETTPDKGWVPPGSDSES